MSQAFEWDLGLLSANTVEFDHALHQLRHSRHTTPLEVSLFGQLASRLKELPGISRREFERRFRLIVSTIVGNDSAALAAVAGELRNSPPEALNAIRTLLPPELRHVAVPPRTGSPVAAAEVAPVRSLEPSVASARTDPERSDGVSRFGAVALIGTAEEHVRNKSLLNDANLIPLPLRSLDELWKIAETGLCGFVVGGSVWAQLPPTDHREAIHRLSNYSTFFFVRICVDGINSDIAHSFLQEAAAARCGLLDSQRFCHGLDSELSPGDVSALQSIARLLDAAGTADFFPLGLAEADAGLIRLIAADRRHPIASLTMSRLGTRELVGGRSGARVFLLNDGSAQPFVVKLGKAEQLTSEVRRYRQWIASWEPNVTTPTLHTHMGAAAISYRLQADPDGDGAPAPTLEDKLEQLRLAEWTEPIETCWEIANDIYRAVERTADRLVILNSKVNEGCDGDEFWLHWPVQELASRGIDFTLVNNDWETIGVAELIGSAVETLEANFSRAVVHGDIHGRNILLLDRLPAFIDFAESGPGHPLVDLVRLDAVIRSGAMRMLVDKRAMHDLFHAVYVEGDSSAAILGRYPIVNASPLAVLAVRTAAKVREASLVVSQRHGIGLAELLAMYCVVSAHVLANRSPGSGIERLMLSVVGTNFLAARG